MLYFRNVPSLTLFFILLVICIIAFSCNYIFGGINFDVKPKEGYAIDGDSQPVQMEKPGEHYPEGFQQTRHVQMGVVDDCDDGKTNLTVDWDYSPSSYSCNGSMIPSDPKLATIYSYDDIPKNYVAEHECMSKSINYSETIPTYGMHRPVWPVYGEYKYLPVQRWLHSLEHGAIVALYHPCASALEVKVLKSIVKICLRRYIISPSNLLDKKRPLALVSWGWMMTMSFVQQEEVEEFIRRHALRGPEAIADDGDFDDQLIEASKTVSNFDDIHLCPGKKGLFLSNEILNEDLNSDRS